MARPALRAPPHSIARSRSTRCTPAARSAPSSSRSSGRARAAPAITTTAGGAATAGYPSSKRYMVPAGAGASPASRLTARARTSANTGVLRPISSISVATGVGSPGTTSLA